MREILSQFENEKFKIIYLKEDDRIGLQLIPHGKTAILKDCEIEPLIQLKLLSDAHNRRFTNGLTLRGGESVNNLKYVSQSKENNEVVTEFSNNHGHTICHNIIINDNTCESFVTFKNTAAEDTTIEMISSFSLGGLTPFYDEEETNSLLLHRFLCFWSAEGKLQTTPVEELQLERSWSETGGMRSERFGQVGSMPVRKYFPFMALSDTNSDVTWGASIACASSWQMEIARFDNGISISGGLADREFGHWYKTIAPNEEFITPKAVLSACIGGIDDISDIFTKVNDTYEEGLPVLFNEYCTTWGNPTIENIKKTADAVKGKGIKYLIIDCGWYANEFGWEKTVGDWNVNKEMFPNGLSEATDYIRKCGMIPGIWFEFETVGRNASVFNSEHLLKRDGVVITTGDRRFWDMADPWVNEYLEEKVIGLLKKYNFGYIKVDYNENIGIGCDGEETYGEELRKKILKTQDFFGKIRAEIPDIVIENCASGGHRLEHSMMELCDMASFSDAHECVSIPIIAANLHRLINPTQSQIWAVLKSNDIENRLYYSIISTFLGRMCLSGDVYDLSSDKWEITENGIKFYEKLTDIIKYGKTSFYGDYIKSYNRPEGVQIIVREFAGKALVVIHSFLGKKEFKLELGKVEISAKYGSEIAEFSGNTLIVNADSDYQAQAFIVKLDEK